MTEMTTVFRRDTQVDPVPVLAKLASDLGIEPAALAKAATEQDIAPLSVVVTLGGGSSGNRGGGEAGN